MYTLEGTVLIQSSLKFVRMFVFMQYRPSQSFGNFGRMFIFIESRADLNVGQIGSKTWSLDQILE